MNILNHGVVHFNNWEQSYIPNILQEIYLQKIYQPYLSGKQDLTLFDLGSNISLWSLYAARYAKIIYAFEPALETYKIGLANLKDNGVTNVTLIQKAVSNEDGSTTFYHSTNTTMSSLVAAVDNTGKQETVETIRLDTFVKQNNITHIDFMKVDTEGVEDKIFASESFQNIVPILDSFVYEWHSWSGANPNIINAGLRDMGFVVKQIPSEATIFGATKR